MTCVQDMQTFLHCMYPPPHMTCILLLIRRTGHADLPALHVSSSSYDIHVSSSSYDLQDMQTFLHCIVVLMHLEKDFTEDLVDLYLYYAMVGLGQQSGIKYH